MGPALRGAAVIQGGQGRPPLQGRTGTVRSGTARTPSPTHSVIARSEATRQSVLLSPKRRIPAPVTRSLARNDSAPRWERRDTWVPPYGVRQSSRADRVVRPYNGTAGTACPTHSVIARSEATRQSVLPSPKRRIPAPVCTPRALASRRALARNDSAVRRRDVEDAVPYEITRDVCNGRAEASAPTRQNRNRAKRDGGDAVPYTLCSALGTAGHMGPALRGAAVIQSGQGRPPLQSRTRPVQNGTSRTPSPTMGDTNRAKRDSGDGVPYE